VTGSVAAPRGGETADGTPIELGGQWVGPTQDRMYELIAELGLETFPTHNRGQTVVQLGGKRVSMSSKRGATPKLNPFVLADLGQAWPGSTRRPRRCR
jgi:monoamine oxidase